MTPKNWQHAEVFSLVDSELLDEASELRERRISHLRAKKDKSVADLIEAFPHRASQGSGFPKLLLILLAVFLSLALLSGIILIVRHMTAQDTPTEQQPPLSEAHTHHYEEQLTPPSCTEGGYTLFVCAIESCGHSYRANELPPIGHTERIVAGKEPTYTENGYTESIVCDRCGSILVQAEVLDVRVHHYEQARIVLPTCTERGYTVYTCSDAGCTNSYIDRYTLPTGHTAGPAARENEKAASCAEEGSYDLVTRCTDCAEVLATQTVATSRAAHTPGAAVREAERAATCEIRAHYDEVRYCVSCHSEVSRETVYTDTLAHGASTYTRPGGDCTKGKCYTVVCCTLCGDTLYKEPQAVTAQASHTMSDGACTVCGMPESSEGLLFAYTSDNEYILKGLGSCTDESITVGVYQGLTVSEIADECFLDSPIPHSLYLSDGVREIGESVAEGCPNLTSLHLGEELTRINLFSFHDCPMLTRVFFPESLVNCQSVFNFCSEVTFSVAENNPSYRSIDGNLYSKDGEKLIRYASGKADTTFRIPDGVKSVSGILWTKLDTLIISADVISISKYTFVYPKIPFIVFEQPEGWYNATTNEAIDAAVLADPASAAAFLQGDFIQLQRRTD